MAARPGTRTAGVSGGSDAAVSSVAGRTGDVVLDKTDVGLADVDNTADTAKPVSTAQAAADALKVAKAGDTMTGPLDFIGSVFSDPLVRTKVSGDSVERFVINGSGTCSWGSGSAARDTNLYRSAADTLRTDDSFHIAGSALSLVNSAPTILADAVASGSVTGVFIGNRVSGETQRRFYIRHDGQMLWGPGGSTTPDVTLYRDAADVLATDDTLKIKRSSTTNQALNTFVGAEANARLAVQANGTMTWGGGSGAGDTNLYRSAVDVLRTDDSLDVGASLWGNQDVFARSNGTYEVKIGDIGSKAGIEFGSARDTNVYRSAADTLKTDDSLHVGATFRHLGSSLGFFNAAAVTKPTVTGSRGDGSALADLLTELATLGLITDSSTA